MCRMCLSPRRPIDSDDVVKFVDCLVENFKVLTEGNEVRAILWALRTVSIAPKFAHERAVYAASRVLLEHRLATSLDVFVADREVPEDLADAVGC